MCLTLLETKMKKISMLLLTLFAIASLLMFTGCKASDEATEPTDETAIEETTPADEAPADTEAAPEAE
jgi:uncharacterized lipoprotein YajG